MEPVKAPTICLSMIVKNEAHILRRCLDSVKPYIDHWIICDTGSTDSTRDVVEQALSDLPGAIHNHEWRDFGYNRSLALQLAAKSGCDYTLVIDADETLVVDDPLVFSQLTEDAYRIEMWFPGLHYPRVNIMRSTLGWRYVGVIHEYPTCTPPVVEYLLSGVHMWTDGQGARGKSADSHQRDLITIRKAVKDEPQNPRYWFYLGQICETNGLVEEAISAYGHRVTMGDYYEEIWYSRLRMAQLYVLQNQWPKAILNYLAAYEVDPTRAESLYWLALGYHNRGHDRLAMVFLEAVCLIHQPVSALFVEDQVYQILRWVHYAVCLHNLGQQEDARIMAKKCVDSGKVPAEYEEALERILQPEASAIPAAAAAVGQ